LLALIPASFRYRLLTAPPWLLRLAVVTLGCCTGNGRAVRTFVEAAIKRQTDRVFKSGSDTVKGLTTLLVEDFTGEKDKEDSQMSTEAVLTRLDGIVGLHNVKEMVHSLHAQLSLAKERKEAGLASQGSATLHMIFAGNPGTLISASSPPHLRLISASSPPHESSLATVHRYRQDDGGQGGG
jgi:hypothetical protein